MDVLTLLIALVTLGIAILAFQRTGGIDQLRGQIEGSAKNPNTPPKELEI